MRRVLAVALIATLTTMMIGIDRTSWASQDRDQEQAGEAAGRGHEGPRRDEPGLHRNNRASGRARRWTWSSRRSRPDAVTVMRQEQDQVVTETIPISDIAKIKKASVKKMSKTSKVLIGTAVAVGVLRHRGPCVLRGRLFLL